MDQISEERLGEVHPVLAAKIRAMAETLQVEGISIRVTQGLRTWDEQQALYAQGRSTPGKIVTNAEAGSSYHNFGLAVDVVPMTTLGPDWNVDHPVWKRLIEVGESLGLVSGAMWRTFPDYPHFQLTGDLPLSPNAEVRYLYENSGVMAVWHATGLPMPPTRDETEAV